jgi:hypothetical protein
LPTKDPGALKQAAIRTMVMDPSYKRLGFPQHGALRMTSGKKRESHLHPPLDGELLRFRPDPLPTERVGGGAD